MEAGVCDPEPCSDTLPSRDRMLGVTWRNMGFLRIPQCAKSAQVCPINCNKKPRFTKICLCIWGSSEKLQRSGFWGVEFTFVAKQDYKSMKIMEFQDCC